MLQRVQTVYMLASVIAMIMMMLFPLATFQTPESTWKLTAVGLENLTDNVSIMGWSIFVLIVVMLLVPFVAIFLYKKRQTQLRFLIFASILNLLYYGLFFYECHNYKEMIQGGIESNAGVQTIYNYMMLLMPALGVFCNWMAIRGILHDILLLKSLERLR